MAVPPTIYPPQWWFDQLLARYENYSVPMLPSDISGLLGKQMTEQWNKMPEMWRWKPTGWPKDPKFIERAVRDRIADWAHAQKVAKVQWGAHKQRLYAHNERILSSRFRGATFILTLAAAAAAARYVMRKIEIPALEDPDLVYTKPTIIIDDLMETGKGFTITGTKHRPTILLVPGAGVAYSTALVMTFHKTEKTHWREGHIFYTLPAPIRKYVQVSFQARTIGVEGPAYLAAWLEWDWAGFRYWAGFNVEPQNVLYPFELLTHPRPTKIIAPVLGGSVTMAYTPSSFMVDTETLEYYYLMIFGQLIPVKGKKVWEDERTNGIGRTELHFQVWHPWRTYCRVDLDSVVVTEHGPYRDDLLTEDKRRSKVMPLTKDLA